MYWYVLFVRTGQEEKVKEYLRERLDSNVFTPFVPLQEIILKISGTLKREVNPLFPSYVFIQSEVSSQEFIKKSSTLIYTSRNIISILKYSNTEIALRESEKKMLLSLCNEDYCIESSRGIIEGDKIHIIAGPLRGLESIVKKVNRHKRKAWIEIEFMGEVREISLALEIVERVV